jgi:hypothetical protein
MPRAVERFLDSFLKLAGFDDRRGQDALNDAFVKIDSDLLKLSSANADTTPSSSSAILSSTSRWPGP